MPQVTITYGDFFLFSDNPYERVARKMLTETINEEFVSGNA
jgi:hypothetical protein